MQTLTLPAKTQLPQVAHERNPGMALDLDWVASVQANTSAIERRAATLGGQAVGQERVSGGLAVQGHILHRPDHAVGR